MFRYRVSSIAARAARAVSVARPVAVSRPMAIPRASLVARSMACRMFATEPSTSDLSTAASELSAILRQEHRIEKESADSTMEGDSEYFESYLKSTGFKIIEAAGKDEVELVREAGNGEIIRVFFSTSDVINNEMALDDAAAEAEESINNEQQEQQDGEEITPDEDMLVSPIRLNIVIEKPNGAAISVEALAKDDEIVLESVVPYPSAKLATDESAEADYVRRQLYMGPAFVTLDPSVQSGFYQYLEERNIDADLASFVNDFAAHRENNEYVLWLSKLADFVEA